MSAPERKIAALEQRVRELEHLLSQQLRSSENLWMESGVSARTSEPFIHMRWGDQSGQLSANQAREHALHMLECADGAEFDAAFVKWAQDDFGLEHERAVMILGELRKHRSGGDTASVSTER
jgi:hypothetical protein